MRVHFVFGFYGFVLKSKTKNRISMINTVDVAGETHAADA
jgi:hypothetical protein